jgi:uncharacterized membrane protein AbrB (regulator of aidB expression)
MSATARYALAFLAAALVGALLGSLVFGVPLGPIVGACVAVVLVALVRPPHTEDPGQYLQHVLAVFLGSWPTG